MVILKATNIHKSFVGPNGQSTVVLENLELNVNQGDFISIQGVSGSGKSTLLHILGGLDSPNQGKVLLNPNNGEFIDIYSQNDKTLAKIRNQYYGFVFQFHHLLPEFTVLENVMLPSLIAGNSKSVTQEKAKILLNKVNLSDKLNQKPTVLSGGEQQRVAIARALINNPLIVYADEPTGNLDSANTNQFLELIVSLIKEFKTTFVIATHSIEIAELASRRFELKNHRLIELHRSPN